MKGVRKLEPLLNSSDVVKEGGAVAVSNTVILVGNVVAVCGKNLSDVNDGSH